MSTTAAPGEKPADAADKLLGVELLRFASAVAVLVFHFQHWVYVGLARPGFVKSEQPFYVPLKLFYDYGSYGVQIFWCISGFIFFWKYGERISGRRVSGREFFVLRLSRLYPLHLATLLFLALGQFLYWRESGEFFVYRFNDAWHFLLQLFLASNWGLQQGDSFNGPIWSISIEVLVYALFFLSLRFLGKSVPGLAAILVPAMLVIVLKISGHPFFQCVRFFYIGCFVALLYGWTRQSMPWRRVLTVLGLLALAGATIAVARGWARPLQYVFVAAPALLFLTVSYVRLRGWPAALVAVAGNMTYASYLLHVPLQLSVCLVLHVLGIPVPWRSPMFFFAFMIGTLALSHVCYTYFEMPAQNVMRRRLLKSRNKPENMAVIS